VAGKTGPVRGSGIDFDAGAMDGVAIRAAESPGGRTEKGRLLPLPVEGPGVEIRVTGTAGPDAVQGLVRSRDPSPRPLLGDVAGTRAVAGFTGPHPIPPIRIRPEKAPMRTFLQVLLLGDMAGEASLGTDGPGGLGLDLAGGKGLSRAAGAGIVEAVAVGAALPRAA